MHVVLGCAQQIIYPMIGMVLIKMFGYDIFCVKFAVQSNTVLIFPANVASHERLTIVRKRAKRVGKHQK